MKTLKRIFQLTFICLLCTIVSSDVYAQTDRPNRPANDRSRQIYKKVTQSLKQLEYPVNQLESGASYIPDQLMVWYPQNELGKINQIVQNGKKRFGKNFKVAKSCGCKGKFQIDLYEIKGMDIKEEGDSGSGKASKAMGIKEEDQQDNIYLLPYMPKGLNPHAAPFGTMNTFQVAVSSKTGDPVVIAILDTGIDHRFQNQTIRGEPQLVFWENKKDPVDGKDDQNDPFCLKDDIIGWDFVNNDNNPMDDHSHGTHLAGIVAKQIGDNQPDMNYQLMAVKVMDANGVGNTFDAVCGILYAAEKGAKVINASWGFYGGSEKLLKRAIRYAWDKGAMVINAAGNERTDLAITNYYPAEYSLQGRSSLRSLLFVGATDQNGNLWDDTNFRTEGINQDGFVATPGENIESLIPHHLQNFVSPFKSGTSMAAPHMSAIMANAYYTYPKAKPDVIRNNVLDLILKTIPPRRIKRYGKIYPYYPVEWLDF